MRCYAKTNLNLLSYYDDYYNDLTQVLKNSKPIFTKFSVIFLYNFFYFAYHVL